MHNIRTNLLDEVATYYSEKLAEHGSTPRGVDWNGSDSQTVRFDQLCKIIDSEKTDFSLNDLGCGYGALIDYMLSKQYTFSYTGIDISEEMTRQASLRNAHRDNVRFIRSSEPDTISDYSIASGIFNVRLSRTDAEWAAHIKAILDSLDRTSRHGFSFNCLTSYSDTERQQEYLYYADPCELFDFCKTHYSRDVALLHDYGLYEFTILVRKTS